MLGSLCMYLSARFAQKSWMKSNNIPYWICFFLLSSFASQILVAICYTHIVGGWCDIILATLSLIFAWKQYRKLNMVIQWSIVDLRMSEDILLLEKQVWRKRRFNRILTSIWIGISCLLVANFIGIISQTTELVLRMHNHSLTDNLICKNGFHSHHDSRVFSFIFFMVGSQTIIGCLFLLIPYTVYGLCTMCVLLWRLFKGKTGYRTHFHIEFITPLIQP